MKKIVLLFMVSLFSCASEIIPTDLQQGDWFGENTSMMVSTDGAKLEFTCSSASIDEKIILNETGSFVVKGTYLQQQGNIQITDNLAQNTYNASFEGVVVGDELTITVINTSTKLMLQKSKLKFGVKDFVKKCP